MIRRVLFLVPALPALLLAGCAPTSQSPSAPSGKPMKFNEAGLGRVMGKTARELTALFGDADLDGKEGAARRMQFVGPACVLDVYLYPAKDGAEPAVTYLDARTPAGDDMDRASCVAALTRRAAAP